MSDDPREGLRLTEPGPLTRVLLAHPTLTVVLAVVVALVVGLLAVRPLWI